MGLFCYFILLIMCVAFPRSRRMALIMAAFIWILYGCNTYSGDFANYENVYNNIFTLYRGIEPGFAAITLLCKKIGLGFIGYRMVLATVYVALLYSGVRKLSEKPAVVLAMSVLFPVLYFVSVLRSGFAAVILLHAVDVLRSKKAYSRAIFVLLVILAVMFHKSSVFFLLFIFARRKIDYKKMLVFSAALVPVLFILFRTTLITDAIGLFTDDVKILRWFDLSNTVHPNTNGIIAIIIVVSMTIITEKLIFNQHRHVERNVPYGDEKEEELYRVVDGIASLSILFLPLVFFADAFMRLYYSLLPLILCVYTGIENKEFYDKKTGRIYISILGILTAVLVLVFFYYANQPYFGTPNDGILIFKNNMIFGHKVS